MARRLRKRPAPRRIVAAPVILEAPPTPPADNVSDTASTVSDTWSSDTESHQSSAVPSDNESVSGESEHDDGCAEIASVAPSSDTESHISTDIETVQDNSEVFLFYVSIICR